MAGDNGAESEIVKRCKQLILERKQVKASLTRFITFLDKYSDDQIIILETRLGHIEQLIQEFNRIQSDLEIHNEDELESDERDTFEQRFFTAIARAKELISQFHEKHDKKSQIETKQPENISKSVTKGCSTSFPSIDLIKFTGDYEKWPQFRDLFITLVHDDKAIDNVRKFYYLISSLKGDAAKVLDSIQVTGDNYELAWNLLNERYDNQQLIIKSHVKCIFELPAVSKDKYSLRNLLDDFNKSFRALKLLGENVEAWDTLLIYLITNKIDSRSLTQWEELLINKRIKSPSLSQLLDFLSDRCKLFETTESRSRNDNKTNTNATSGKAYNNTTKSKYRDNDQSSKKQSFVSAKSGASSDIKCALCKEPHYIYRCKKLLAMPVASRITEIEKLSVCSNCLRTGHAVADCLSQGCKVCSDKHNTILHTDQSHSKDDTKKSIASAGTSASTGIVVNHCVNNEPQVLLSTVNMLIKDGKGNWHQCRALLDNGSQSNFITSRLLNKLNLPISRVNIPVVGVGVSSTNISSRTRADIKSTNGSYLNRLDFLILDKITEKLPSLAFNSSELNLPEGIVLSDSSFNVPAEIDILLGASVFFETLRYGTRNLGPNKPLLQKTVFGWLVSGSLTPEENRVRSTKTVSCHSVVNLNIQDQLERFWQVEECPQTSSFTTEEEECERIFTETTTRDSAGHFVVELPVRENVYNLGTSLDVAVKRLHSIERKFKKNADFKERYLAFMSEYERLGHMTKIDVTSSANEELSTYHYLPHHGVLNVNSTTTKLRTVFDGSCKSETGLSLNDVLLTGPTIQDDLFAILLRFRKHNIVITADVEKMYRMVQVAEKHRDLQRIVWRYKPEDDISHYRLNTVTYGTSASPFLAIRSIRQAAIDQQHRYPEGTAVLLNDMYVDDIISGAPNVQQARKLKSELIEALKPYGFKLRKWSSNESTVHDGDDSREKAETNAQHICENDVRRTLGIVWHADQDILTYSINVEAPKRKLITKRTVLSTIASIFDPLGLVSPVVIRFKILMQRLWQQNLRWDDPLPREILDLWQRFSDELLLINKIQIPRHAVIQEPTRLELHCFSDASQAAYGTCIYIKSINSIGQSRVRILCSKSRVAPLKTLSIPRLELCGAILSVKLCEKVNQSLKLDIDKCYYWTDSTIVLAWIATCPSKLKIFVSNRIAEIQRNTKASQWRHVPTGDNPADLVSRGISPIDLKNSEQWWSGPTWLYREMAEWPTLTETDTNVPELKPLNLSLISCQASSFNIFDRFSSFHRLQRVIALCFRFYNNLKLPVNKRIKGSLSVDEVNHATNVLLKLAQTDMFPGEIASITHNKPISRKSKLLPLDPILGSDGLLHIGGRLSNSDLPYESKHQIILAANHPLTKLIVISEHYRQLHSGVLQLLSSLRKTYWIIHGRRVIRSILRTCIVCFRCKPTTIVRKMADLPADRVTPTRPFYVTGVDFAGPFHIKDGKLRNRAIIKAYLCIFICFTTKAVHLEAVSDLSSQAFLNSLHRFISRRGLCHTIYSDNGTNFTGSHNELSQICENIHKFVQDRDIANFLVKNSIKWNFIPPRSPHQGGLWESAVKRAKFHMSRILGKSVFTFEEISTLFAQIEAVMNSRPITPLSDDPSDLAVLTPGHFLIGDTLLSIPQHDLTELPENRLDQFQRIQQRYQFFWKRWSRDYLLSLQPRSKWQSNCNAETSRLQVGSMVLVMDENLPPLYWRLGRITKLHPGRDNITRVVTLKTSSGEIVRAVQKLSLLPIDP